MIEATILLVEDNPDDQALTLRSLKKHHLLNRVIVANDGLEAQDYLFGTGKFRDVVPRPIPRLVLLDLQLPKIDGIKLLQLIRSSERTRNLPVVIMTSSDEQRDMLEGNDFQCDGYLHKPVDFAQLVDAVKLLGVYWVLVNQTETTRGTGLVTPSRARTE